MHLDAIIWLGLMAVFLVVEAACAIHLVSIWFAAGSLAAAVTALLGGEVWLQVTLFLVVSCVILGLMWPFVRKFLNPGLKKTNLDSIIGSEGLVIGDILLSINNRDVTTMEEMKSAIFEYEVGQTVEAVIYRAGQRYLVELTLDEAKG